MCEKKYGSRNTWYNKKRLERQKLLLAFGMKKEFVSKNGNYYKIFSSIIFQILPCLEFFISEQAWPFKCWPQIYEEVQLSYYRQVSNISHTLAANKIVDHSDVVGASPVGAAPITSSFSTEYLASIVWAKTNSLGKDNCKTRRETLKFWVLVWLILEIWWYLVLLLIDSKTR